MVVDSPDAPSEPWEEGIFGLVGWLVLPVGAWAYHEGPGQDRVALEATEAVLASAHQAASEGDWKLAIREYEAALESLPKDPEAFDVRVAQRVARKLGVVPAA